MGNGLRSAMLGASVVVAALLASTVSTTALTEPQGSAVTRPEGLTLRLPWGPDETHVLGAWRYNQLGANGARIAGSDHVCGSGAQDCYALDVVGTDKYPLTTANEIRPLFPGTVVYAGCASGGSSDTWKNYGKVAYVETVHEGAVYGAFYAHLSDLLVATGDKVAVDQPLGHVGSTGKHLDGSVDCHANDPAGNIHLHLAVYHFDQPEIHPQSWWAGGPHGGNAVVPEPFVGVEEYQDLGTFSGTLTTALSPRPPDTPSGSDSDGSARALPVAQWVAPAEAAQVTPRLTLIAWPTPVLLNGSLVDDPTTARIDFRVAVDGAKVLACSADRPDDAGRWTCQADLLDLGVADGAVEFTFDVVRTDGGIAPAPDGVRTVVYESPLMATWRTPPKGAKLVKANPRLAAKVNDGSTDADRVIFRVRWGDKKPKRACIADDAANSGIWSCRINLWKLGAPLGRLKLSFDVVDVNGDVSRSPAGVRNVRFAAPPPRPTLASVSLQPLKVQRCPKLVSFRSNHGGCCTGDGRICDYRYRLSWADTPGETGYRIYERGVVSRTRRSSCTLVDQSRLKLIATLPANSTSYTGDFVVPRWDADYGRWRTGATFFVVPFNDAGPARSGVAKRFVFDPSGDCPTGPS